MSRIRTVVLSVTAALAASPLVAQGPITQGTGSNDPEQLLAVQAALQDAIRTVEQSVVSIETFGGARPRRNLPGATEPESDGPDRPTPEQPPQQPGPDQPSEPEDPDPEDEGPGPIRLPQGFAQAQGTSTGVIVSADGWILTTTFALAFDPTTILVTLADGRSFHATRAGEDTSRGLALLRIEATDLPVPEPVARDDVRVGAWAFALGRTFGARGRPTVHAGIVSAVDRLFGRAIQTDAFTSPANYGGPVIDLAGRVYGISAPLSPAGRDAGVDWYDSGVGFAVQLDGLEPVLARLRAGETLYRAWLGIRPNAEHLGPGAVVGEVLEGSPAELAGLGERDLIVGVDGERVRHAFHLRTLLGRQIAGDEIVLNVRIDDETDEEIRVVLGRAPQDQTEAKSQKDETFTPPWEGDQPSEEDGDRRR